MPKMIMDCLRRNKWLCAYAFLFSLGVFATIVFFIQWIREMSYNRNYKVQATVIFFQGSTTHHPEIPTINIVHFNTTDKDIDSFNPDFVDIPTKFPQYEIDKNVRSKRNPDEIDQTKIRRKRFETGIKSKKDKFITHSNSADRPIETRVDSVTRIKRQINTNNEKMLKTKTKERLSTNRTIEQQRQSRIIPSLVGFISSWLRGSGTQLSSDNQTNIATFDEKTKLSESKATEIQNNTIELRNILTEEQSHAECETCETEISIAKMSSTVSTMQKGIDRTAVVTTSSIESNVNKPKVFSALNASSTLVPEDLKKYPTKETMTDLLTSLIAESDVKERKDSSALDTSSTVVSEDIEEYRTQQDATKPEVTISVKEAVRKTSEKSSIFLNAVGKRVQTQQDIDTTVASTEKQIKSTENSNNENLSLVPYENLGSVWLGERVTESNDWLIKYCFEKLVLNHNVSDQLPVSLVMNDVFVNNTSDAGTDQNKSDDTPLEDISSVSKHLEQELMADLQQAKNNSGREARFLDQLTQFFDFFGSGNSARMVGENSEKIIFDDATEDSPIEEFDDLKFAGQECAKFFQSILRGQTRIAKPNLIDLLTALREEFTESPSPVPSRPINFNSGRTNFSAIPAVPSLFPKLNPTNPSRQIQTIFSEVDNESTMTEDITKQFEEPVTSGRDGRFFNIFGFGSGGIDMDIHSDNKRKTSDKKFNGFSFGNMFNFGSGVGEIKDQMKSSHKDNSVREPQTRRLWDFLGFGSGDSSDMQNIETSSENNVEKAHRSLKNSTNDFTTYSNEVDTVTSKIDSRFFGSLFGSGNFHLLENEDTAAADEKNPDDESDTLENNIGISESIQNFSTEKNKINFSVDVIDFGNGQERDLNLETVQNKPYLSTTQSQEGVFVTNFDVGVKNHNVRLNSVKNDSMTFTNSQNNLTDNRLNESTESHKRSFFSNLFGLSSGDGKSFEESTDVNETVTNSVSIEHKTEAFGRFFFFPDFSSGGRSFQPEEENESLSLKQDGFSDDLSDLGSGEGRVQNIGVTDYTDTSEDTNTKSAFNLTNNISHKRVGDWNEIQFDNETGYTSENYSTFKRTRSREPRLRDEPDMECNDCDNHEINNDAEIATESSEFSTERQMNFSNYDSHQRIFPISHLDEVDNSTVNESKPLIKRSETKDYDNEYITSDIDKEHSVTAESKNDAPTNTFNLPPRPCQHSSQCDNSLNEKCIFNGTRHICGCGRSFVKHPVTRKCESKIILETILRFPQEDYKKDLKNPNSIMYKQKMKDCNEMMRLLLSDNADLAAKVADFSVIGFSEGSLIVYWNLVLAASENETMVNIRRSINQAINETLTHEDVLRKAPLKTENVRILRISLAVNPCQISDLNYCSQHADCIRDNYRPGGFLCRCKAGTVDLSETPRFHPGEVCKVICSPDYCGTHGHCAQEGGEKECLCRGWYFGNKCEISGVGLVSAIAGIHVVLLLFVACVCYVRAGRKRRHAEYGRRQRNYLRSHDYGFDGCVNTRVNDVVALNEQVVDVPSKFYKISMTPAQPQQSRKDLPEIKVIPPSVSNMSYSVDSSFDTPSDVSSTSVRSMTL